MNKFAIAVREHLKNNQTSLDEFIEMVDAFLGPMSNATDDDIKDWVWRNKK